MKKFIFLNIFFIKESKNYIGKFKIKQILFYPIAYLRFMYYSYKPASSIEYYKNKYK